MNFEVIISINIDQIYYTVCNKIKVSVFILRPFILTLITGDVKKNRRF